MSTLVIGFVVAGVLMIAEYLLCTKLKNPLWGGILVIVNTIFLLNWGTGRDKYKKIQQSEMDKMKAKDI